MSESRSGPPPLPAPLPPRMPLTYARPVIPIPQQGPPARFVVVGWIGMIYAVLSILANGTSAIYAWDWMPAAPRPMPAAVSVQVPTLPPPPIDLVPFTGDLFGPRGFAAAERKLVLDHVARSSPLPLDRQFVLDSLLAERGADWLSRAGSTLTADDVARDLRVVEPLRVPPGRDVVTLKRVPLILKGPGGRIDLFPSKATLQLINGRAVQIDSSHCVDEDGQERWSFRSISDLAEELQIKASGRLTPAQLGAFAADRRSASTRGGGDVPRFGGYWAGGTLVFHPRDNQNILFDPQGRITRSTGPVSDPAASVLPTPSRPSPPPGPQISRTGVWLLLSESVLSFIVAAVLLPASHLLRKRAARAVRYAGCYATGQFGVNVLGAGIGIAYGEFIYEKMGIPSPGPVMIAVSNLAGVILSSIWPATMLWATRGPIARQYLNAVRSRRRCGRADDLKELPLSEPQRY